jgi:signal transduction histidine kinase
MPDRHRPEKSPARPSSGVTFDDTVERQREFEEMTENEIDASEKKQLSENALFQGLPLASLETLLPDIPIFRVLADEVILTEGITADEGGADIFLLLAGTVKVLRALPENKDQGGTQISAGTFFGEMAVFAPGRRSARVVAAEPATIARINGAMLDRIIALEPLTVVSTITRTLAERLREANDAIVATYMRQEKLAAIGAIVGQIAHDLKSPLSAVAGVADLMEDPLVGVQPQRHAQMLRRAVQSVTGLVEDILAFASDRPRRPYQRIAVRDLLNNVEDFGLAILERRGVAVNRHINTVCDITGDSVAIERMLLNLIKNAGEAMSRGGTLGFSVTQVEDAVEFVVQDTGAGIPEEVKRHLFESFVTSGKPGGTGLGLAMVKRTVDAHGGTISVESSVGVGTRIVVRIPCSHS